MITSQRYNQWNLIQIKCANMMWYNIVSYIGTSLREWDGEIFISTISDELLIPWCAATNKWMFGFVIVLLISSFQVESKGQRWRAQGYSGRWAHQFQQGSEGQIDGLWQPWPSWQSGQKSPRRWKLILWAPWMSVSSTMAIYLLAVETTD